MLRRKIMDAARAIFVEEGYEAVTMRRIADRIEYSATAIYSHFKDKDALIRAITYADFMADPAVANLGDIVDPVERLRRPCASVCQLRSGTSNQYRLIFMSSSGPLYDNDQRDGVHGDPDKDAYAW